MAAAAATPSLLRGLPHLLLRIQLSKRGTSTSLGFITPLISRPFFFCTATKGPSNPNDEVSGSATETTTAVSDATKETTKISKWFGSPEYRSWKDKESEILRDIEPITLLTKEILHSGRYMDGECLTAEDEKAVVEKLLKYHPHSEDKIGSGLDSIMVDRHPQFRRSRCLFVVRIDGGWIDFSYQKCLRAYIRDKYPTYAKRFIREHFKR